MLSSSSCKAGNLSHYSHCHFSSQEPRHEELRKKRKAEVFTQHKPSTALLYPQLRYVIKESYCQGGGKGNETSFSKQGVTRLYPLPPFSYRLAVRAGCHLRRKILKDAEELDSNKERMTKFCRNLEKKPKIQERILNLIFIHKLTPKNDFEKFFV